MNWKRPIILFLFAGTYLLGVVSCSICQEDQLYFRVLKLFVSNAYKNTVQGIHFERIPDGSKVNSDNFQIVLTVGVEYFTDASHHESNPFIQFAWACESVVPPQPAQRITSLQIFSSADFLLAENSYIPAGGSLNDIFLLSTSEQEPILLKEFMESGNSVPTEIPMYLYLKFAPGQEQYHRFTVYYELDESSIFEETTDYVLLSPG